MTTLFSKEFLTKELTSGPTFTSAVAGIQALLEQYQDFADPRYTGYACVGTDLDHTMTYSLASMDLPNDMPSDTLLRVIELYQNKPLSHTTSLAYLNLELINNFATLVPMTTRTEEQLNRVKMPGTLPSNHGGKVPQYAVTTNGAKILVNGIPDASWHDRIISDFEDDSVASIKDVGSYLHRFAGEPWLNSIRHAESMFLYMTVNPDLMPNHLKLDLAQWMLERNWEMSDQGKKIYFIPHFVNKGRAFLEVVSRLGSDYTMTSGDSSMDAQLLDIADLAFRPKHGELERLNYLRDNLTVTNHTGILAGEEITARMLAQIMLSV